MNKQDVQLLFEYDRWANARVLTSASALRAEQFTRDLGGSFRSVRDTLVHILGGQWIWLAYWKEPPGDNVALTQLRSRRDGVIRPDLFPDVATLRLKWAELEREQANFVDSLTDESLAQLLPFRSAHVKLAHLIQHVVNHSTYHRGQVAVMMRQLGAEPVATDFHGFVVEATQEPAVTR
jgi:uncharacterized damage-inducible protein DinB